MKSSAPLKDNQAENIEWAQWWGRGVLADEPGLGKSRSAIEAFDGTRTLVIAPAKVLSLGNWDDEIEMWSNYPWLYTQASYTSLNATIEGPRGGRKPVHALKPEYKGHWDTIIVDESHMIKGRKTPWTWAVNQLARNCDNMLMMTGTPIPNWAHEVFTLLKIIYPDESKPGGRYGSFWRWAVQWFDTSPTRFSQGNPVVGDMLECTPTCSRRDPDDPCAHYVAFARENFGARFMRHLRRDCLDLPPLQLIERRAHLDAADQRAYKQLARDFATDIGDTEVLAWSSGAKNVLLDKFTTSPWLLTKKGPPRGGKFELLRSDVTRGSGHQLVFAHYRDTVEACADVATSVGRSAGFIHGGTTDAQNTKVLRAFKRGDLEVLVGSLETMAEGLTLTIADTAIRVERSFKPSRNIQATYRFHRLGQDKPCTMIDYLMEDTVDIRKSRLLADKNDHQMKILTAAEFARNL